jgi:hypothetical protein
VKKKLPARLILAAAGPAADAKKPRTTKVSVMTRNLFVGTDLKPIAIAQPGADFERTAASDHGGVVSVLRIGR